MPSYSKFVVELDKSIYVFIKPRFYVVMTSFNREFIKKMLQKYEKYHVLQNYPLVIFYMESKTILS